MRIVGRTWMPSCFTNFSSSTEITETMASVKEIIQIEIRSTKEITFEKSKENLGQWSRESLTCHGTTSSFILLKLRAEAKNEKEDEEGLKTLDGDEEEEEEEEKGVEGELW
ncbi:hypothetical protein V1477_001313 [Vespula maculifrons]|uniref:Uncharacterized protein n=1 Tax=Vespula maculifrons TaxID=7453 RepID=A0ABD2CZF6_VESMC